MAARASLDVGSAVASLLDPAMDVHAAVDQMGVQYKHRGCHFVTKLSASGYKGNFHVANCLCHNGSGVNPHSNHFLSDSYFFDSPHPLTLGAVPWWYVVCGHSLSGGQLAGSIFINLLGLDLWDGGKEEDFVLNDEYFYKDDISYDSYLCHLWLKKNWSAPVGF